MFWCAQCALVCASVVHRCVGVLSVHGFEGLLCVNRYADVFSLHTWPCKCAHCLWVYECAQYV